MSQILLDQVQKHRREIKHEALTFGISELISMHKASPPEILIQPEWQRLFRWSRAQQSYFIESLILEVPIPPLFFFENNDGRWELLDGLQRLSTILKFMGNDFDVPTKYQGEAHNDDDWHYETQNDIGQPLQLEGTEYLGGLAGLSFARLPTSLKLNLKRGRLHVYVLKRETDRIYKYEVFRRLNQGGSQVEDQEVRNCATRILDDQFPDFIRDIAKNSNFVDSLQLNYYEVRSAYLDELALRFFTMKNYGHEFRHDVSELLTTYMELVATKQVEFDFEKETKLFEETWELLRAAYDDGTAFRARRADGKLAGPFSPNFFEMISLAVASNIDSAKKLDPTELRERLDALKDEAKNEQLTGSGSNSRKKTQGRLHKARGWLSVTE